MAGIVNLSMETEQKKIVNVEIGKIFFNSTHRKVDFSQNDVATLAQSYSENCGIQPLSVKKIGTNFELITGEKQYFAAKMCEMQSIPCVVYEINDRDSAIDALVEHIRNHNLSFFEEACAIENLLKDYGFTQEEAAAKLGKAQSTIANKLRLLRLSESERDIIIKNNLTERHARALLRFGSVEDRIFVLNKVIDNNLNVEKTEIFIENYIGKRKNGQLIQNKTQRIQNISMFLSTINKAVESMRTSGIKAETKKLQGEEYVEYRVRIPMKTV